MNKIQDEINEVVELPKKSAKWFIEEIRYLCRVLISSVDRFYWEDGFSRSASLAYTFLLSLVPFTALSVSLLGSFTSAQSYMHGVVEFFFKQFVPKTESVDTIIQKLQEFQNALSSLNVVTIPFIVITSILLLNSIEYALNKVWQVFEPRKISQRLSIYCAIIVIAPILAVSAYYTTRFRVEPLLYNFTQGENNFWLSSYQFLLPFFIDFIAFTSLYYLVPKAPVQFRPAVFGAFFTALLFNLAKAVFALYIKRFSSYSLVYGATIAAIPIFLFWLYCGWTIVLFGAEISYQAQYLPRVGQLWKKSPFSVGDGRLVLAMQGLITIAKRFTLGERLPNEIELAENLGCSTVVLKPALFALRKAQILSMGDSPETPITLTKRPEVITLLEIRNALFPSRETGPYHKELGNIFSTYAEQNSKDQKFNNVTLADIINREN